MRKYAFTTLLIFCGLAAFAQNRISFDTNVVKIPMTRVIWHENIDKEQKRTDRVDGKIDNFLKLTTNEDLNIQITDVILRRVDEMQLDIERMDGDNNFKIGQLRSLRELLQAIASRAKEKEVTPLIPQLFSSYEECMKLQANNQSMMPVFEKLPYQGAELLSTIFVQTNELNDIKKMVFLKKARIDPSYILQGIAPFENEPFADSLILLAADKIPMEVYSYAQATKSVAARVIRRNTNPKVQTIAKLSSILNGTLYLPFLDELLSNRLR